MAKGKSLLDDLEGVLTNLIELIALDVNLWSLTAYLSAVARSLSIRREDILPKFKRDLLERVCSTFKGENLGYVFRSVNEYLETIGKALVLNGYYVKECIVRTTTRTIVGVSEAFGKPLFEVALSFDPILNIPYIPGSTLKGAFRYALVELIGKALEKKKQKSKEANDIAKEAEEIAKEYFGGDNGIGLVGVTDAYPISTGVNGLLFESDIITPHYPGAGNELKAEPKPLPFLTIARGVKFRFFIYINREIYLRISRDRGIGIVKNLSENLISRFKEYAVLDEDLAKLAKSCRDSGKLARIIPWLDKAVLYAFAKGIGAKTSTGYSRFEIVKYSPFKVSL